MTLQECYDQMGANYQDVISRLMTEERVKKYITKFFSKNVMASLTAAVQEKNYEQVFLHSHNMKGVCLNLGLTPLTASSSALCEAVRGGEPKQDIGPLFEQVQSDYDRIISALGELLGESAATQEAKEQH